MPSFTIAIRSVYLKHKNVVVNGSNVVRSASALFQFYIKIRCRYGCRKVGRGFFDLFLQIMPYLEKKPYLSIKPLCAGSRKHFFALRHGHREIIIVVIRNDRVLHGLYSVLFMTGKIQRRMTKKDLPQNNGD